MIARKGACVVVADGGGATVYRIANRVNGVKLDDIEEMDAGILERTSALGADRPTRVQYSTGHNSAVETRDLHDEIESRFAAHLAERMEDLADLSPKGLILFAAPRFLGQLRAHLSDRTMRAIKAQTPKDLRKARLADIEAAVGELG